MPPDPTDSPRFGRRGFFRRLISRGIENVEHLGREAAQRLMEAAGSPTRRPPARRPPTAPEPTPSPSPMPLRMLRPPGALPEDAFTDTCSRCGKCAEACPVQCIVLDPTIDEGRPHIVARHAPCVMCEQVACTTVCPSGALQLLSDPLEIAMGRAEVDAGQCLRSSGEDCRICVHQCPVGEAAIGVNDAGQIQVHEGCTGCGVCECACPTEPESIFVVPVAEAEFE